MTLPELNRYLLEAERSALVIVPAFFNPWTTERHFPDAQRGRGRWGWFPNGSTLTVLRGVPWARDLFGTSFHVALVLTPVPDEVLKEVRRRLIGRNGTLFAPFAAEAAAAA